MKHIIPLFAFFILFINNSLQAQTPTPFITTWRGGTSISLGITGSVTYQLYHNNVPSTSHTSHSRTTASNDSIVISSLSSTETYELRITYPSKSGAFRFPSSNLITVEDWGNTNWSSMSNAFKDASKLTTLPTTAPLLSNVRLFEYTFDGATIFNQDISNWDVSSGTNFQYMFANAKAFNQPLGNWIVSNGLYFKYMFTGASSFNQNINNWDVSKCITFEHTFSGATAFNQPLNNWNVGNSTSFHSMFSNASSFNYPIGGWNVSNSTIFLSMFNGATAFNQDISAWDVSKGTNFSFMFSLAISFNQPIGGWNVGNGTNFSLMFNGATAFNRPIGSWNVSNGTNFNQMFQNATLFNQPIGTWNVGKGTNFSYMFNGARAFDQDISGWDVSKGTSFSYMFQNAILFNQPIGSWNVGNGTNFAFMFNGAAAFNQPIGSWNVSNGTNFNQMFQNASSFNQPIGSWNVGNVNIFSYMFNNALAFDQDINSWDVSKGTTFAYMFGGARSFNRPLNNWNVSAGTNFAHMFNGASAFNQNLGNWKLNSILNGPSPITPLTGLNSIFVATAIDCHNLGATLKGWSENTSIKTGLTFNIPSTLKYSPEGTLAINTLRNTYNWTINTGGGVDTNCLITPSIAPMITEWSGVTSIHPNVSGVTHYRLYKDGVPLNNLRFLATQPFPITLPNTTENFQLYLYYDNELPARTFKAPVSALKKVLNWGEVEWTSMQDMFKNASGLTALPIDTPISHAVQNFSSMFENASVFNQPLINWNVYNGTSFTNMFEGATAFNQTLHTWNINASSPLSGYMLGSGIDCDTLTATLNHWANSASTPNNITLDLSAKTYSQIGTAALNDLATNNNWVITSGTELTNCISTSLPLELIAFKAMHTIQNNVLIQWKVADEKEVAYYTVEKSNQNKWEILAKIAPNHTNDLVNDYSIYDKNPTAGNNIYRLKITELDGTISYSTVSLVNIYHKLTMRVYPNPAQHTLTVALHENIQSINILNIHGQTVLQKQVNTPAEEYNISVDQLPKGIYFIQTISNNGTIYQEKWMKQ